MYCSNQFALQISLSKNETILEVAFHINVIQMWAVSDQQDQQKAHRRQTETLTNLQQVADLLLLLHRVHEVGYPFLLRYSHGVIVSSLELKLHNTAGLPKPTRSGLLLVQAREGGGSIVLKPTEFSKSDKFTPTEKKYHCCCISYCPPIPSIPCVSLKRQKCDHASNRGKASAWKQEVAAGFPTVISVSCKIIRF